MHGHDEAVKAEVALLLTRLGLNPIILNEQANRGMTVAEKLENYSDVGFAVILITPDDVGGKSNDTFLPRARQNVILELGYFWAKLGPDKLCPLYGEGVELPSDFGGIVYTLLDRGGIWKTKLVQELQGVGYDVNANQLTK